MKKSLFSVLSLMICINVSLAQLPSYVPTNGLVGFWPFNGNTLDQSGNGNNGVNINAVLSTDRFLNTNRAYVFNGSSSYIQLPILTSAFNNNSISVSLWFQKTGNFYPNSPRLIDFGSTNPGIWSSEYNSSSDVINYYWPKTNSSPSQTPVFNRDYNWHHVVLSIDANNNNLAQIYIDGILANDTCCTSPIASNLNLNWLIGSKNGGVSGDFWQGSIDDIGIWNRALSQTEILELFNSTTSSIDEYNSSNKKIVKVLNMMGQETKGVKNQPLIIQYEDGTTKLIYNFSN
jgi:hypothetical protein